MNFRTIKNFKIVCSQCPGPSLCVVCFTRKGFRWGSSKQSTINNILNQAHAPDTSNWSVFFGPFKAGLRFFLEPASDSCKWMVAPNCLRPRTQIVKNQIVNCQPNRTQTEKMGADMLPKNGQKRQIALKPIAHATVRPDTNSEKMVHQLFNQT